MSKHNYSQYSSKNRNENKQTQQPQAKRCDDRPAQNNRPTERVSETKPEPVKPIVVQETVETVSLPETVEGFVVNCAKLNVREAPTVDSEVVCVLDAMSEIMVDVNKSTNKWVYVYTGIGMEGYCMRQYIDARL